MGVYTHNALVYMYIHNSVQLIDTLYPTDTYYYNRRRVCYRVYARDDVENLKYVILLNRSYVLHACTRV